MRQGVPDNSFHVCDELTFSRILGNNGTERYNVMMSSLETSVTVLISDQGIVEMRLRQSYSTEVRPWSGLRHSQQKIKTEGTLKIKTAECCAFQQQFLDPPNSTVDWCKSMLIRAACTACTCCSCILHVPTEKGVPNMITPWRCEGSGDMNSLHLKCTSLKYTTAKRPSKFFCETSC